MRLAVIMSTYNDGKYLRQCIESILNQTFRDFLFFITDDNSTDETHEIIKNYDDKRIFLITNIKNKGLSSNLNSMIFLIKTSYPEIEFIARQDSDDWSLPERFERQIGFFDSNKDHVMIGTKYLIADEQGKILKECQMLSGDDEIRNDLYFQNWFGHGSIMFLATTLYIINGYDERFVESEDYELYLRIMELGKIANIEYLYVWRNSRDNPRKRTNQVYYVNLARYKDYCDKKGIVFEINNYHRTKWK